MSLFPKMALLISCCLLVACGQNTSITRPEVFEFGASLTIMQEQMSPLCTQITVRDDEPLQLPTATRTQAQLDCEGFLFEGKKRKVELIFADDQLDIVWILTEPEEEEKWITDFTEQFGAPTHQMEEATFFLDNGVAVRNQPHEILFLSDRLKEPYRQWLSNQ